MLQNFRESGQIFKRVVYDNYRGLSFKEMSKEIITKKTRVISNLLKFIIVLPMSSVPCERHNTIESEQSPGNNFKLVL